MATPRPDVRSIGVHARSHSFTFTRREGQQFYETPKTWTLWQETPYLRFIRRFLKRNVYVVLGETGPIREEN